MAARTLKFLIVSLVGVPFSATALSSNFRHISDVFHSMEKPAKFQPAVVRPGEAPCAASNAIAHGSDFSRLRINVKMIPGSQMIQADEAANSRFSGIDVISSGRTWGTANALDLPGSKSQGRVHLTNAHILFNDSCKPIATDSRGKLDIKKFSFYSRECQTTYTAVDYEVGTTCPNKAENIKDDWAAIKFDKPMCPQAKLVKPVALSDSELDRMYENETVVTTVGLYNSKQLQSPSTKFRVSSADSATDDGSARSKVRVISSGSIVGWNQIDNVAYKERRLIYYGASTLPGGSGGAVFTTDSGSDSMFAIHVGPWPDRDFNVALKITPEILGRINAFASK